MGYDVFLLSVLRKKICVIDKNTGEKKETDRLFCQKTVRLWYYNVGLYFDGPIMGYVFCCLSCSTLTRVVLAVVLFHDAFAAEAQVHFASVGSAHRFVIVRALGLAFAGRRNRCRRAGRLHLVVGAHLLVVGRSAVHRRQDYSQR